MPRIDTMFAYVVSDKAPDDEGVIGMQLGDGSWAPLMGADFERALSLRPVALSVARGLGKEVRLLRFSGPPELVETITP